MEELHELLVDGLRDIYDAEKQLVRALPRLTKALTSDELKQSFNNHLEQTKNQVTRVEQCLELLGEKVKSKPCKAMKGLVEEAQEHLQEHEKGELLDQVHYCLRTEGGALRDRCIWDGEGDRQIAWG